MSLSKNIIYFDTECMYCNRFIIFILDNDKRSIFYFSKVTRKLSVDLLDGEDTIIYTNGKDLYQKSEAILKILEGLEGKFKLLAFMLNLFPSTFSNYFYDHFAKRRYKLPFKLKCRLLSENERNRFLNCQ